MKSINEVTLLGNLTRDPELRYTPSGKAVITIGLATNDSIKQADGTYLDVPEIHTIIFWGKSAEVISKYCNKGNKLLVKGRIKSRKYTDKANIERYITEVLGRDFVLLTPKPAGAETVRQPVAPGTPTDSAGNAIEDIIIPDDTPNEIPTVVQDDMPF
jgi:single-strand DNA-binding protein